MLFIVAAVSTAAWFQINTTKKEVVDNSTIKSGTPNLSITNSQVTGYKIQQSLGPKWRGEGWGRFLLFHESLHDGGGRSLAVEGTELIATRQALRFPVEDATAVAARQGACLADDA